MEKYSVLMSLYIKENPSYLEQSIESMINQTVKPSEIVIVKDGNISNELQMVLDCFVESNPSLIKIYGYEKNMGLGYALNYGLERCENELVARMDTDDISKLDRCEKQLRAFADNPNLDIYGSAVDEFISDINVVVSRRVVPTESDEIYKFAKRRSAFNHPTVMFKKSSVLNLGGYSNMRRNQDVDLFGRMLYAGCLAANTDESLLFFRSNDKLAKRRKSWGNTWSYIQTINKFRKLGYSNMLDLIIVGAAQIGMFILPIKVQNFIYKKFLRK